MSLSYQQTFLLDCSMVNAEIKNDEMWSNRINTLSLSPNDTISLYTAYINQLGSDGESISIEGGDSLVNDNQTRITIIPYLNNTANNNISLPYNYTLSNLQRNMIIVRDDQNKTITGFSQDRGQFMTGDDDKEYYTTLCYSNIANYEFTDPNNNDPSTNKYRFYDRFGAIQDGQTTDLKTYLSSGISTPNGDRHTGMVWDNTLRRYVLKEITIDINIEPSSYSPSNLATLITDNLTLTEENIIENVLDEHGNKSGYFFQSKTNFLDFALYTSINILVENQGNQNGNNPVSVYPQMSPIMTISRDQFSTSHSRRLIFKPKQDSYFSLGKNLNGNDGNCEAYKWVMGHTENNEFIPSVVFFKYPFTQLYGGELNNNQAIDFNFDVKNYVANNNNPTPTIPNYVKTRGQTGFILTDLLASDENKLKVKKFFDAQLQEHNIDDLYCYDFSSYVGNISAINNRTLTKKGDETKHRWINIGINNNFNTNTLNGGDTLGVGMIALRKSTDSSLVYNSNTNPTTLMEFCCDYLGEDTTQIGGLGTTSVLPESDYNTQFRFNNWTQNNNVNPKVYSLGGENVNGDTNGMDDNNYGTFNDLFDINCINTRYVPLPQLIKINENKTYPNNDINDNYGYFSIYTAQNGREYIMLEVDNTCGGFQTNVIEYAVGGQKTQNLFFNVGFTAYGNEAIMKCVGQGTQYDKTTSMDDNGTITITNYGKSIIQNSLGASEPTIAFSDQTSRFFISNAYEPCRITNGYLRTGGSGQEALSDGGTEVLLLNYSNFQKQRVDTGLIAYPYVKNTQHSNTIYDGYNYRTYNAFSYILPYKFSAVNHNTPFYYQEGGIFFYKFIENLSLNPPIEETEENFNSNSLFYKLGFRFNQFNISDTDIDYLKRNTLTINQNGTINLQHRTSIPITNNSDLINTANNNSLYVNNHNLNMFNNQGSNNVNQLQIESQSTIFLAKERPIKTTNSYYLVCSDILQSNTYYSKELVNCVDIVEKSINSDDFYYSSNSVVHTITRPYEIQNITHSIKKPNLTFLKNQNYSSVIYRITKNIITGYNPTQMENLEILQNNLLKKLKKPKVKIPTKKQALLETLALKRSNEQKGEPKEKKEENEDDDEEEEEEETRIDTGGLDDLPPEDINDILEQIQRERQQRQQDNEEDGNEIEEYYREDDINRGDEML